MLTAVPGSPMSVSVAPPAVFSARAGFAAIVAASSAIGVDAGAGRRTFVGAGLVGSVAFGGGMGVVAAVVAVAAAVAAAVVAVAVAIAVAVAGGAVGVTADEVTNARAPAAKTMAPTAAAAM
jgi:hypothetical protein